MSKKIFWLLISFGSFSVFPQTQGDSLDIISIDKQINETATSFEKQLNIYSLSSWFILNQSIGKLNLSAHEIFQSTFINTPEKNIRDEQSLQLSGGYNFSPKFKLGLLGHNRIHSDSRKIEINQASSSTILLYSRYVPLNKIIIAPFGGITSNRQIGEVDDGYVYGAEAFLDNYRTSDFTVYSEIKFRNEDILPRKNSLRYFNLGVLNIFNNNVSNQISLKYTQNRKDFYYEADSLTSKEFNIANNIQSRSESNYLVQDAINFKNILDVLSIDLLGKIGWRTIDRDTRYRRSQSNSTSSFDTEIEEFKAEIEAVSYYAAESFSGILRFIYSERDEKHKTKNYTGSNPVFFEDRTRSESRKNNTSGRTALSFTGNVVFSSSDRLSFSIFQNKLLYDTPSSENFDDRDELLSIVRLRYSKQLTPYFETFVSTEGTINKTVYLFASKSSNNNVNRVLKLSSGGNYYGKNFSSQNTFDISANYTVYDFEDLNPNYKSFSFRQFSATDSSTINLGRGFRFSFFGYLKLSEQGDFNWGQFSARPTRFIQELFTEPKLSLYYFNLLISVGARYFGLTTYSFLGKEKIIDTEYRSVGPLAEISLLFLKNLDLKLYGWYEFITQTNQFKKEQANMSLTVNWNF